MNNKKFEALGLELKDFEQCRFSLINTLRNSKSKRKLRIELALKKVLSLGRLRFSI